MCGGHGWRKQAIVGLGAGGLPKGPLSLGAFGPGVAQLQIALIKIGAMAESAIIFKQGVFGPHTAHAVATLQEQHQLEGPRGTMDEQVAKVIAEKLQLSDAVATPVTSVAPVVTHALVAPTVASEPPAPPPAECQAEELAAEKAKSWPVVVKVGSSKHANTKVVTLPGVGYTVSPIAANAQATDWNDQFEVAVSGDQLTVRRTDAPGGWGQELELVANLGEEVADDFVQVGEAHLFQEQQRQSPQEEAADPAAVAPTTEPPAVAPAVVKEERWADKLEQLAQFGFLDRPLLTLLLDRHDGSIISVVTELLGQ